MGQGALLSFPLGALQWRRIEQKVESEIIFKRLQNPRKPEFHRAGPFQVILRVPGTACVWSLAYRNIFGVPPPSDVICDGTVR
jgi:hypothetical protein